MFDKRGPVREVVTLLSVTLADPKRRECWNGLGLRIGQQGVGKRGDDERIGEQGGLYQVEDLGWGVTMRVCVCVYTLILSEGFLGIHTGTVANEDNCLWV